MHLVGFRYNESKNPANKFYDGLANNTIDWNKVYYSGPKYYTEKKLDAFTSFFTSNKYGILINDGKVEISYEITNKKNAILQIEKNIGNENYFPKSFKSVNISYLRNGVDVNIVKK